MRATAHFFALGAALLLGRAGVAALVPRELPTIEVVVPRSLDSAGREIRIEEALLVEEGLRFGWARSDPVIRRRLVANMAFAGGVDEAAVPPDDEAMVGEALALGMQRSDPVVRGRLLSRMRELLSRPPSGDPDAPRLEAYLAAHRDRYEQPGRVRFTQLALSRQGHGDHLAADAAELLSQLRAGTGGKGGGATPGDSLPLLPPHQDSSVAALDARFGDGFGESVAALPVGDWAGPVASSYGLHVVRVDAHEDARLPPLSEIRERVLSDYLAETRPARIAERVAALRARYRIRVIGQEGEP